MKMKKKTKSTYNIYVRIYKYKLIVYNFISLYFRKINKYIRKLILLNIYQVY